MKTEILPSTLSAILAVLVMPTALFAQVSQGRSPGQLDQTPAADSRFEPLPSLPHQNIDLASYTDQAPARFLPIPPLEDLPPAPSGLYELASVLEQKGENPGQEKVVGSDFPKKMTRTGGLGVLTKPLEPHEIIRKTDARKSKPEKEAFIQQSWQNASSLQSPQSEPDPRLLKNWPVNSASWASPAFCYKPLYFEQPNLERYGIGYPCPTNAVVSAGRFFADATLLPLHALRQPPRSCECTLGHRRPGDCNPIQR